MNYRVLFFGIGLAIFLMGTVLFYVVGIGAKHAQQEVLTVQQARSLTSPDVVKGLFFVGEPSWDTLEHSCDVPFLDHAYISIVMHHHRVPRLCSAFVNGKHVRSDRNLAPDCILECPNEEFSRTFPLGMHDVREDHVVRVCCNEICVESALLRQCGGTS